MSSRDSEGRLVRWRYRTWFAVTFVWFLFLVQAVFPPEPHVRISLVGGLFWAVVLAGLLYGCRWSWRGRYE